MIGTKEIDQRITESSISKSFAGIFKDMLKKPFEPLIRVSKDGTISFKRDKPSARVSDKERLTQSYNDIVGKIDKELGKSPHLQGLLGEKYNEIENIRKKIWLKLDDKNVSADNIRELLNELNNRCETLFQEMKKLQEENADLSSSQN